MWGQGGEGKDSPWSSSRHQASGHVGRGEGISNPCPPFAKAHPRQCCTAQTLLALVSAICAVVSIVPFCLPLVPSVGRWRQAVLSPEHPCPCKVLMPFPRPLPLSFPVSCFPAGRGGQAEAGNGFTGWKCLGGGAAGPEDNAGTGTAVDGGLGNRLETGRFLTAEQQEWHDGKGPAHFDEQWVGMVVCDGWRRASSLPSLMWHLQKHS